ncbi:MAG: T9SS type A sorting domain-containing protein [Ferruginibacter sp.]
MKKLVIAIITIMFTALFGTAVNAQNASLELSWISGSWNPGGGPTEGPSLANQVQTFQNDALNNSNFSAYSPPITVTTSLRNQNFTGYNYAGNQGTVTTGLSFGTSKSEWDDNQVLTQGPRKSNLYDLISANVGAHGPIAAQFKSFTGEAPGTIDPDFSQFGSDGNGGVAVFSTVEPLRTLAGVDKNGRYLYGELVITFSQAVKDPVIHIGSLGGSSWYQLSAGAPWNISYFSTELELVNTGVTSTKLSGTDYLNVVGNNILNSAARPNGASTTGDTDVKGFSTYGAASGSVQITGTVTELVYKVYMRGSSLSDYPFTFDAVSLLGSTRNPFYGDYWSISYSFKKPVLQIVSGNIFVDKDITDGDINKSFLNPNDKTNAGCLNANLISNPGGIVVKTVPVGDNGQYLFDNVAIGNYTVQISCVAGVVGQPQPTTTLPANWQRTGDFIGSGPGSDGNANGVSAPFSIVANQILTNVNFGIKAGACPNNILYQNPIAPSGYFGGFELAQNFFPLLVNLGNGPGAVYARTTLAPANYSILANAATFGLSSYNALGGNGQMAVKPTANNETAYYLVDSLGKNAQGFQTFILSGSGSAFKGWFAKGTVDDAIVKVKIYDADDPAKIFVNTDVTLTGAPGTWTYWNMPWLVNYGTIGLPSLTKKVRFDIISVNGIPFSIDELCLTESAAGPIVPITISDFTANNSGCTANLVWKTSTESNSDRFEVEVSTGNGPGFGIAGTVLASGYSTETKTYQYSYPMQAGVVYYFRLKMIDKDGSFKYSDTRSLSCSKGKGGIVIAPNPVITDHFNISGMETGKNSVIMYAANGQMVRLLEVSQTAKDINVDGLPPGLYTVKVTSESGNTVVKKLIIY